MGHSFTPNISQIAKGVGITASDVQNLVKIVCGFSPSGSDNIHRTSLNLAWRSLPSVYSRTLISGWGGVGWMSMALLSFCSNVGLMHAVAWQQLLMLLDAVLSSVCYRLDDDNDGLAYLVWQQKDELINTISYRYLIDCVKCSCSVTSSTNTSNSDLAKFPFFCFYTSHDHLFC